MIVRFVRVRSTLLFDEKVRVSFLGFFQLKIHALELNLFMLDSIRKELNLIRKV
jgi:hypothetical protein